MLIELECGTPVDPEAVVSIPLRRDGVMNEAVVMFVKNGAFCSITNRFADVARAEAWRRDAVRRINAALEELARRRGGLAPPAGGP